MKPKQKLIDGILYFQELEPQKIHTDAVVVYVQKELVNEFKKLNISRSFDIEPFNYKVFTSKKPFWYVDENEEEQEVYNAAGTWRGNMYISTDYNSNTYDSTFTVITFNENPLSLTSGTGYWVDYYSGDTPWDYICNHITWNIQNNVMYINFTEDNTVLTISNFGVQYDRFVGIVSDNENQANFEIYYTSSPNWSSYLKLGYNDWLDNSQIVNPPIRYVSN